MGFEIITSAAISFNLTTSSIYSGNRFMWWHWAIQKVIALTEW
jgi:hypothetical protein